MTLLNDRGIVVRDFRAGTGLAPETPWYSVSVVLHCWDVPVPENSTPAGWAL